MKFSRKENSVEENTEFEEEREESPEEVEVTVDDNDDFTLDSQVKTSEEPDGNEEYPDTEAQDDLEDDAVVGFTATGIRSPKEAIAYARNLAQNGTYVGVGLCLKVTRTHYNVPALYPDASTGWRESNRKHRVERGVDVPRGAPVWWTGGPNGFGHVAISTGNGYCYSTDFKRSGRVDLCKIDDITRAWGLNFQGWTNDINDVFVKATPRDREPQPEPKERRQPNLRRAVKNLRAARQHALKNNNKKRAEVLGAWIRRIVDRFNLR